MQYRTLPMATPGQAWKAYWSNLFTLRGRSTRAEYWWIVLFQVLASFALALLLIPVSSIAAASDSVAPSLGLAAVQNLFSWAFLVLTLGLFVRRFHDTGRSTWHALIVLLAPYILGPLFLAAAVGSLIAGFSGDSHLVLLIGAAVATVLLIIAIAIYGLVVTLLGSAPENEYGPQRAGRVLVTEQDAPQSTAPFTEGSSSPQDPNAVAEDAEGEQPKP